MQTNTTKAVNPRPFTNKIIHTVAAKKHRRKEIEMAVIAQGENLDAINFFLFQHRGCGTYA